MSKKEPPAPLLHLPTSTKALPKFNKGIERLVIELPVDKHMAIKMRSVALGKSLKDYALYAIELHADQAIAEMQANPDRPTIEGAWHVKRIAVDIPPDQAAGIREKASGFKTLREFVLRCIEVEMGATE
jgi:hypothetical protein